MAVISSDAYEKMHFESEVYFKLREAEMGARTTNQRYSHKDLFSKYIYANYEDISFQGFRPLLDALNRITAGPPACW